MHPRLCRPKNVKGVCGDDRDWRLTFFNSRSLTLMILYDEKTIMLVRSIEFLGSNFFSSIYSFAIVCRLELIRILARSSCQCAWHVACTPTVCRMKMKEKKSGKLNKNNVKSPRTNDKAWIGFAGRVRVANASFSFFHSRLLFPPFFHYHFFLFLCALCRSSRTREGATVFVCFRSDRSFLSLRPSFAWIFFFSRGFWRFFSSQTLDDDDYPCLLFWCNSFSLVGLISGGGNVVRDKSEKCFFFHSSEKLLLRGELGWGEIEKECTPAFWFFLPRHFFNDHAIFF